MRPIATAKAGRQRFDSNLEWLGPVPVEDGSRTRLRQKPIAIAVWLAAMRRVAFEMAEVAIAALVGRIERPDIRNSINLLGGGAP
jgi:hypothetical protein